MRCLSHSSSPTRELHHKIETGPQGNPESPQGEAVEGSPLFRENPTPWPSPSHVLVGTRSPHRLHGRGKDRSLPYLRSDGVTGQRRAFLPKLFFLFIF